MVPRHRILQSLDYSPQLRIRHPKLFTSRVMWRIGEPQTLSGRDLYKWLVEGFMLYQERIQKYIPVALGAIQRFEDRTFLYMSRIVFSKTRYFSGEIQKIQFLSMLKNQP